MKTVKYLKCDLNTHLIDYFKNPLMHKEVNLVESGVLKLHWSNWDKLLNSFSERFKNGEKIDSLKMIYQELEEFRATPVWFKNKQGSVVTNLYDLYSYFLDPRLKELWFEINEETLISFESASGPFIRLQSMRWFDFSIYRTFVYNKLLKGSGLTERQFRLTVDMPAELIFVNSILDPLSLDIIQVTKSGLLVKLENKFDIQKVASVESLKLKVNFSAFKDAYEKPVTDFDNIFKRENVDVNSYMSSEFIFKKHILKDISNSKNLSYSNGEDFFLFIKFSELEQVSDLGHDITDTVTHVLEKCENYVEAHLKKVKTKTTKKAA